MRVGRSVAKLPVMALRGQPPIDGHEYLTANEVAAALRVDPRTVYRMIDRGELAAVRAGRSWRVPRAALASVNGGRRSDGVDWGSMLTPAVVDALAEALVVFRGDGTILSLNEPFRRLAGVDRDALVGSPVQAVVVEPVDLARTAAVEDDGHWRGDARLRRGDGAVVAVGATVVSADGDGGTHFVGMFREVPLSGRFGVAASDELVLHIHGLTNSLAGLRGFVELLERLPPDGHPEAYERLLTVAEKTANRLRELLASLDPPGVDDAGT